MKKIMTGDFVGGIPIHQSFEIGDSLVDPLGQPISFSGMSGSNYRTESMYHFVGGKPTAGATVFLMQMTEALTIPQGGAGSKATSVTAATGSAVFNIYQNATVIGTITFNASTAGVFAVANAVTLATGDTLKITAPNPQNSTLADIAFNIGLLTMEAVNPNITPSILMPTLGEAVAYTYAGAPIIVEVPATCNNVQVDMWGGGGYSEIYSLNEQVSVTIAGGGGGAGPSSYGGDAGIAIGGNGSNSVGSGAGVGFGGSQYAGGAGYANGAYKQGGMGMGGDQTNSPITKGGYPGGGNGGNYSYSYPFYTGGGGGGGGYYGGGGGDGTYYAGGGGGSSFISPSQSGLTGTAPTNRVPANAAHTTRTQLKAGEPGYPGLIVLTYLSA